MPSLKVGRANSRLATTTYSTAWVAAWGPCQGSPAHEANRCVEGCFGFARARTKWFIQRFQREVVTIASLQHPNIVMAFDAGRGGDWPFPGVMSLVDGRDLASTVRRAPCRRACRQLHHPGGSRSGLCPLAEIIHRDIKPANLMLDSSGTVKVMRPRQRVPQPGGRRGAVDDGPYPAGSILGTVDYMAPEQAIDSTLIDHRADISALAGRSTFCSRDERSSPVEMPCRCW